MLDTSSELDCSAFAFISYQAGLQKDEDREQLEDEATVLKNATLHFHCEGLSPGNAGVGLLQ